jgi:predicted Zn-dependent protease
LREKREDHEIFLRGQYALLPFAGIARVLAGCEERLEEHGEMPTKDRANLLALCAWSYAMFRDFERADPLIDEAYTLAPESSWIHVEKAQVLRLGDRYEEALEWAQQAVEIRPYYRSAVLAYEESLVAMGRDEEAEALLLEAHQGSEMGSFPSRLLIYYRERSDHKRGLWALDEFERLSPLAERSDQEWMAARRADLHYMARARTDRSESSLQVV